MLWTTRRGDLCKRVNMRWCQLQTGDSNVPSVGNDSWSLSFADAHPMRGVVLLGGERILVLFLYFGNTRNRCPSYRDHSLPTVSRLNQQTSRGTLRRRLPDETMENMSNHLCTAVSQQVI